MPPVARLRQRDVVQLLPDVEVGHVLPVGCRDGEPLFDDALTKAIERASPRRYTAFTCSNASGCRVSMMPVIMAKLTGPSM